MSRPYNLLKDLGNVPVSQGETVAGTETRPLKATDDGHLIVDVDDTSIAALGAVDDAKVIDPDAASATAAALLRGLLSQLIAINGINTRWDDAVDVSGLLGVIEIEHAKVHDGLAFKFQKVFSLTDTTAQYLQIQTGDNFTHLKKISTDCNADEMTVELYEAPTIDAQGTSAVSVRNCNRNSSNVSTVDVFDDTTYTADGTLLEEYYSPGADGAGQKSDGGSSEDSWEWLLAPNTEYMVKVGRLEGTGTTRVLTKFKFYERVVS